MKTLHPRVTDLPAPIAARLLARAYLAQAEEARRRVLDGEDPEALHDFRVAVRRLRTCSRAYRTQLSDTLKRRHRRWLRQMTRATNESRDLEVQLDWLGKRRRLADDEARGATWLRLRLRERMWGARANALRVIRHDFPAGRDALEAALSEYHGSIDPAQPHPTPGCAVAGAAAALLIHRLVTDLGKVQTVDAVQETHEVRIHVKRLRYLIEPFETSVASGRLIVQKLKKLQDRLGDLNDCTVMLERIREESRQIEAEDSPSPDVPPSLAALLARVEADRAKLFDRLQRRWFEREMTPLLSLLAGAAAELSAQPVLDGVEIERKFLLRRMPRLAQDTPPLLIDQGWLPGERLVERVRRVRCGADTRWYRTVKSGAGMQRIEIEEETTEPVFRALWRLTRGRRISKRRYKVPDGDLTWEIDRFTGGRLILAEVELPAPDSPVEPPEWLKKHIVREVTGEPEYLNVNLAS